MKNPAIYILGIISIFASSLIYSNNEIELKFKLSENSKKTLIQWIEKQTQSKPVFKQQIDTYILPKELPKVGKYYDPQTFHRVRVDSKKGSYVTYKKVHRKNGTTTHRTELETKITDASIMLAILKNTIRPNQEITISKKRKKYSFEYKTNAFEVVFDTIKKLGNFTEIELKNQNLKPEEGRSAIFDLLKQSNVKKITEITRNYIHLALNPDKNHEFEKEIKL